MKRDDSLKPVERSLMEIYDQVAKYDPDVLAAATLKALQKMQAAIETLDARIARLEGERK